MRIPRFQAALTVASECGFLPLLRFDCEIDCDGLGLGAIGRFVMVMT